jgi:integrase
VNHSWSNVDGLKSPKNGEARRVGLLPEVRAELLALLEENPHEGNPFVFYSENPERPMNGDLLSKHLRKAIRAAGIELGGRSVTFHSFRHYFASRMADRAEADKVARVTGHKSKAMAEHYQRHVTDKVVAELTRAAAGVFAGVVVAAKLEGGRR